MSLSKKDKLVVIVPRDTNSVWAGKGDVVSIDKELGIVVALMFTGDMQGKSGGFDLDQIRFERVSKEKLYIVQRYTEDETWEDTFFTNGPVPLEKANEALVYALNKFPKLLYRLDERTNQ